MRNKFGILSIILGISSILTIVFLYPIGIFIWTPESYYFILFFIIVIIIIGGNGILKDTSKGLGINGVIIAIISIILWIIYPIIY
ncbi:MAG: hypothetical protein ACFFEY_12210 [Candidatus Thorarchaeota archaeon]